MGRHKQQQPDLCRSRFGWLTARALGGRVAAAGPDQPDRQSGHARSYRRFEPSGTAVAQATLPGDLPPGTGSVAVQLPRLYSGHSGDGKGDVFRHRPIQDLRRRSPALWRYHVFQGQAGQRSWLVRPFTITAAIQRTGRSQSSRSSIRSAITSLRCVIALQQELANRRSFFDKDFYRYVVGINGDFNYQGQRLYQPLWL